MTTYNEIAGRRVNFLSSDPSYVDTNSDGQVWYNSTTAILKSWLPTGAWISGGNLNSAITYVGGSGTSNTAAMAIGGSTPPGAITARTELYNGIAWTPVSNMNTARLVLTGVGSQTATIAFSGETATAASASSESWNGSSWTATPSLNTARGSAAGSGSQTAALCFGGSLFPGTLQSASESWNGTSWTNTPSLNTARNYLMGSATGTNTAALAFGGLAPAVTTATESYNGTAWTTVPGTLNTARRGNGGAGTQTAALAFGGFTPSVTGATELYNGTTWTSNPTSMATARGNFAAGGTQTNAFSGGGVLGPGTNTAATEEWNFDVYSYSATAWASGGNLNTARYGLAGTGTQTAGLAFGGESPVTTASESYNGTSWTNTPSMNTARNELASSKIGTNTAALAFGGHTGTYPTQTISAATESYNGSAWTSVNSLNTARRALGGTGLQGAALAFGGFTTANTGATESWNGTSWTTLPATLNTARRYVDGAGTQTAALAVSGSTATATEEWNGSTWTSKNNINTGPARATGATSTAAIAMGGSPNTSAASWNGTSWTNLPSLASGRTDGVAFGTQALAIYAGGYPNIATTEEWTAEVETANSKTLTTS